MFLGKGGGSQIHGGKGGILAVGNLYNDLHKKGFNAVIAVARLRISSMPKNGSSTKYKLHDLTEALLSHVHAYFMFQKFSSEFIKPGVEKFTETNDYIMYLAYKIDPEKLSKPTPSPVSSSAQKNENRSSYYDWLVEIFFLY